MLVKAALTLLLLLATTSRSAITTKAPTTKAPTTTVSPTTLAPSSKTPTKAPTLGTDFAPGQACESFDNPLDTFYATPDVLFGAYSDISYDGNTVAVTALWEQSYTNGALATTVYGRVTVYSRPYRGAPYTLFQNISTPDLTGANYWFGYRLALTPAGDTLAIGALPFNPSADNAGGYTPGLGNSQHGFVYIYTRASSTALFALSQIIDGSADCNIPSNFGASLAFSPSGKILAVGSGGVIIVGAALTLLQGDFIGMVAVLERSTVGENFTQISPTLEATVGGSLFGLALALSEQTLVVGEPGLLRVQLFSRSKNGTVWGTFGVPLTPSATGNVDVGSSVAISYDGRVIAIGAFQYLRGTKYMYVCARNSESQLCPSVLQTLLSTDVGLTDTFYDFSAEFGATVSLDANASTLLVSAPSYGNSDGLGAGAFVHYTNAGSGQGFVPEGPPYGHAGKDGAGTFFSISLKVSGDGLTVLATSLTALGSALVPLWTPTYFTTFTCVS